MVKIEIKDIKLVPVKDIKRNPKNRNKHPKEQIDELARHYEVHGMRTPIIVSNQSGQIVAGDGRFQAALKAKMTEVPVAYQDFETPEKEFSFGVADNGLSLWSELDLIGINDDLKDMPSDFNLDDLGLKDFKMVDTEVLEPGCDEDSIPDKVEPKTKLGDLYILGKHRLLCGDSTNIQHVESLIGGQKIDLVFTDPPYGINLQTNYASESTATIGDGRKQRRNNYKKIEGDDQPFDPNLILGLFTDVKEMFLWGANYYIPQHTKGSWVCWDKKVTESGDRQVMGDFELAWSKNNHKNKIIRVTWFGPFGHNRKTDGDKRIHPTQKPIKLIEQVFTEWCDGLVNVIDLYGGSGSTLIACEKTNRKCFMMELDTHYCDGIVARWEKYTGQTAELIGG